MDKFIKKAVDLDRINTFINGRDPMERIVNMEYTSTDNFITIYYRDEKDRRCSKREEFYPFVWATRHACLKLCDGDRSQVSQLLKKYHIKCSALDTTNTEGEHISDYDDGYIFKFEATQPMSYRQFTQFFKDAGNPLYSNKKDDKKNKNQIAESKADSRQYLVVTPQEQFMISTGKRYFKGYDDYDELLRFIFDLETEGLNPEIHRIESLGIRYNRKPWNYNLQDFDEEDTFNRIFKLEGETEEEKNKSELGLIKTMLSVIYTYRPDVITGHNAENFDWNFVIVRCTKLGTSIEELSEDYFDGRSIRKNQKETILKLGGEVETFYQTIVPQTVVTDSLHAVRRAQALDSNMLRADLKYVTKYSKMKKPNRVYVPGNKISEISNDTTLSYAFNDIDGDWYKITENKPKKDGYRIVTGEYIVDRYLFDDIWECDKVELRYNLPNFLICKMLPVPFQKCCTMGTAGQWKAMLLAWCYENNLAVPMFGEKKKFTGGLSRLLSVGYVANVAKFDYNSLYPSIILTWGISDRKDLMKIMLHFLEYVLTQREKYKKLKKIAGKEKEKYKEMLENFKGTDAEKREIEAMFRKYASEESLNDKKQLPLKILANSFFGSYGAPDVFPFGSVVCAERTTCTGRQALRLMIYRFNTLGYQPIVGDTDGFNFKLPETYRYTDDNPYIGLGLNREVEKGRKYTGFKADVAEFNDMYMRGKMGLGIDEIVSATINFSRKNYADYFPEEAYPEDVKMVGNTIKSKKMPEYISKFLSVGIRLLLQNKGQEFLEEYYAYVDKIYNYNIPLKDIASKGKIKKSIDDYIKDCQTLTKAGRPKSRQAWYELVIKNNIKVNMGDTVYFINTGKSKSHSDIKKVTKYFEYKISNDLFSSGEPEKIEVSKDIDRGFKAYKTENKGLNIKLLDKQQYIEKYFPNAFKEEDVVFNSILLPNNIIESEEDTFCEEGQEYNAPKYIAAFNSRIKPLLVCFSKEIRDKILITNPADRQYFTAEQSVLTSGEPYNIGDQDTFEQLMTMEDKEIRFWMSHKDEFEPPFIEECGMDWEKIQTDYIERMRIEKEMGVDKIRERYEEIINELTEDEVDEFLEGEIPNELTKIITVDPVNCTFVSKDYPDIIIGTFADVFDSLDERKKRAIDSAD